MAWLWTGISLAREHVPHGTAHHKTIGYCCEAMTLARTFPCLWSARSSSFVGISCLCEFLSWSTEIVKTDLRCIDSDKRAEPEHNSMNNGLTAWSVELGAIGLGETGSGMKLALITLLIFDMD